MENSGKYECKCCDEGREDICLSFQLRRRMGIRHICLGSSVSGSQQNSVEVISLLFASASPCL